MKIAIVSDMHIGYERFSEDAFNQAKEALKKASELADILLLPGDIFDKRYPKPEVMAQAINLFRDLSKRKWVAEVSEFNSKSTRTHTRIPVIAISGTHERTAQGKDNPLSLLALAGLLVDTSEATTIISKGRERIAVFGFGGLSEERVKEKLIEMDPKPTSNAFNIFMLHQSIYEILPFSDDFIHYGDLPKGFDLYVCGHIHSRVETTVHNKKFIIPGSTVLTQLKEGEQEQKGFVLFDTENYTHEFIKINSRKFFCSKISFEKAKPKEILDKCEQEIEEILSKSKNPIIKLKLEGTIDPGFENTDLNIQSIMVKYSAKAIIEVDKLKLINPELESNIVALRDNKIGNLPIKDLGMNIFGSKLKELKFDSELNYSELFNILSGDSKKEKVLKEATEFLSHSTASYPS